MVLIHLHRTGDGDLGWDLVWVTTWGQQEGWGFACMSLTAVEVLGFSEEFINYPIKE